MTRRFSDDYTNTVRIALGQINTAVGDFSGNSAKDHRLRATRPQRRRRSHPLSRALRLRLSAARPGRAPMVRGAQLADAQRPSRAKPRASPSSAAWSRRANSSTGKSVKNSAALLRDGKSLSCSPSACCPPTMSSTRCATSRPPIAATCRVPGQPIALTICEDAWNDKHFWDRRAVRRRSGGRPDRRRRQSAAEHLGFAVLSAQARTAPRMLAAIAAQLSRAGRDGQPDRRQRQPGVRRLQPRARPGRQT